MFAVGFLLAVVGVVWVRSRRRTKPSTVEVLNTMSELDAREPHEASRVLVVLYNPTSGGHQV
jgi:hypothetical protein